MAGYLAQVRGMWQRRAEVSPEMRAARLRFIASLHDRAAAELRIAAASTLAACEMRKLAGQMQAGYDNELAAHPGPCRTECADGRILRRGLVVPSENK
jgi:hypothetical protein